MEVRAVRSAVLRDRNFSSTESSGSKGPLWSPARTIGRSQEGTRGGLEGFILLAPFRNLTMRSCFPRDRPSTASWWAAIAATYTFKVEGWQPTLQPFLQERKHYSNHAIFGGLLASETVSVVPHSCLWRNSGSSALLGHVPPWGVPSYSTPRKEILCTGESLLFS